MKLIIMNLNCWKMRDTLNWWKCMNAIWSSQLSHIIHQSSLLIIFSDHQLPLLTSQIVHIWCYKRLSIMSFWREHKKERAKIEYLSEWISNVMSSLGEWIPDCYGWVSTQSFKWIPFNPSSHLLNITFLGSSYWYWDSFSISRLEYFYRHW